MSIKKASLVTMPNNGCLALQSILVLIKKQIPDWKSAFLIFDTLCYLYFITFENLPQWTKGRQLVDKISTKPLHNIDRVLAEGVASLKCNLKKSKGLGCCPTSNLAKWGPGSTACQVVNVYTFTLLADLQNLYRFALLATFVTV